MGAYGIMFIPLDFKVKYVNLCLTQISRLFNLKTKHYYLSFNSYFMLMVIAGYIYFFFFSLKHLQVYIKSL